MPEKAKPKGKSRRETFEDMAAGELGLKEVEVKRGQFAAPCKALVEFRMAGARATPDVFPLTKLQAVGILAEKHGERIRVVLHGGNFINGVVMVGGNDGANSEGVGGLWTVVSISEYAEDPAALAIQRASMHRTFRKDELPDGVKAIPEGQYKDAGAPKEKSFSLWSDQRLHKVGNRRLQATALAALTLAGARRDKMSIDVATLAAPRLLVAANGVKPLQPRFMATDALDADLFFKAQDMIDDVASWCGARGTWDIDGLLKAGVSGVVEKIHPQTGGICIKLADDSEEQAKVVGKPTQEIISLIHQRTGFYVPDLKLVPLVKEGETVGPETVLYGPMERMPQAARQLLRRTSGAQDDTGAWLRGVRLMALLASSTLVDGQTYYPIELVSPIEAKEIFVQVAGEGIHGRWDARIQRVSLDKHPSKHLVSAGLGYKFDLYDTSHRAVAMQRIRDFRARSKAREEEERKAKQAAKRKERAQRKQAEAAAAPEEESPDVTDDPQVGELLEQVAEDETETTAKG
jgi:hypothetical protein